MFSGDDAMNAYRVETKRRSVSLTMANGEALRGHVFIHSSPHRPYEPEDAAELFNADEPFFPLELDDGTVRLVAKARVAEVLISRDAETAGQESLQPASPTASVEVNLSGGERRTGMLRLDAPPGRERAVDVLNDLTARFLTLHSDHEARLINRAFINHVRTVD